MSGFSYFARSVFYALHGIGRLGPIDAFKLFLARHFAGEWRVRPRELKHPIFLRGRTSDAILIYQIFVKREYRLPKQAPGFIVDAGANIGTASLFFARHFPDASIVCIEPEDGNFAQLQRNTQPYANIECVHAGVWSETTNLRIINAGSEKWVFQVEPHPEGPIPAIGFTDLLARRASTDVRTLVKIDVEGADRQIFAGDTAWLDTVDNLYIEVHGSWRELFKAIERFDYDVVLSYENLLVSFERAPAASTSEAALSGTAG
ncbi:MAG: FkbM family methyltransferase [Opitutales bacterium]